MSDVPTVCSHVSDEAISFAIDVVDASHVATRLEALLVRPTGRPRTLPLRAVLVALVLLALDDRALHLKAATRTLYSLAPRWRDELGVHGEVHDEASLLARYRCVRYLFHRMLSVMDPSTQVKNRVVAQGVLDAMATTMDESEIAVRRQRLEGVVHDLLEASVAVCTPEELAGFDGSIGLDATVVPLFARGPSSRAGTCSSDPDGGWYVREGDHRDVVGPEGKKLRKLFWAQEATIVTMGRSPGSAPTYPNLVLAALLTRPGEDPGASAVRLLSSLRARGYRAGFVGADRGYTQVRPERFHLAARALGYRVVMDYKESELGRQANSDGAVLVEGHFYCPAMPEDLVAASADWRHGVIDAATHDARLAARASWRLPRKQTSDHDGYERYCCPALGGHLRCALRDASGAHNPGAIPVLHPPARPDKVCTQSSITIAPDVGARYRQELTFGSPEWARTYATYRNTIEGLNGFVKDSAHESLHSPGRRRVRGLAAQSLFVALLLMAANFRKIATYRKLVDGGRCDAVAERARRRRVSLADFLPAAPIHY